MRILFIYFNKEFRPRTPPALSLLETIVKNKGHETRVFDTSFYKEFITDWTENITKSGVFKPVENLDIPIKRTSAFLDLENIMENFKPDLVGFTYYTINLDMQRRLLIPLKKYYPDIKIIAGGPQVCISPETSIREPYIDMICYGEGDELIDELCYRIDNNEDISDIKGLWIKKENGLMICNGIAPLTDLNTLPYPNLDSYDPIQINGLYNGKAYRMGNIEFTRGCPFNCTYCGSGSIREAYSKSGQKYVRHKKSLIAVMEYASLKEKYDLEMMYFIDGTFTAIPKKVLRELSVLYKKYVNLPFICLVHPLTIDEDVARLLGEMGCVHVSIGIESGIESYREEMFNRKMSNKQIIDAVKYLRDNNIHVSGYNIIGMPGMDREHVFETIKLNKEAQVDDTVVSIFMPFPDNDLTQSLIKKGLIKSSDIVANGSVQTMEIKDMSKSEIEGLYNTFGFYVELPEEYYPLIEQYEKDLDNENLKIKLQKIEDMMNLNE